MARKISSLSVTLGASVGPFVSAFKGAGGAVTGLTSRLGSAGASVLRFTGIAAGIGAVFGALKGAASGITLAAELEQVGVAFETMLGSGEAAKQLMGELTAFSAATPFQFPEIAKSSKKLLAFGVAQDQIIGKMTMLGDISAGTGKDLGELAGIYGKIKSRGQLTGETLNQLAEAGVPIYKALAKEMGVAESSVAGLVTAGKIGFPQVDAALAGLTAKGGQFTDLMKKQSKTLGGLWSTLTDNIGLTMAGMVTTIVDAFSLRDALSSLTSGIGNVGGMLTAAVARWAPIIVGWTKTVWTTITGVWSAIVGWLRPIVSGIGDHIARNWQASVTTTAGYLQSLWGVVKSVFTVAWDLVKWASNAIVSAWLSAMNLMGIETAKTGSGVGDVFQSIADGTRWMMDKMTLALNVISYSIKSWRLGLDIAVTGATLSIITFGNQVEYVFTKVIPGLLTWFANNWRDVFQTILNVNKATFENMGKNAANFFSALWSAIKGEGFNFVWTPLLEGFESTIKELPQIAARVPGELEAAMTSDLAGLTSQWSKGLADTLAEQEKAVKDATAGMFGGLMPPTMPPVEIPTPVIPQADTSALTEIDTKAKATAGNMKAVFAGSAEAMQMQAAARFSASLAPAAKASPAPGAAPVPPEASRAMREGKEQTGLLATLKELTSAGNKKTDDVVDLLGTIARGGLSAATF